jgi:NAD-dependent DNA ligase
LDFYRYGIDDFVLQEHTQYSEVLDLLSERFSQPNLQWTGTFKDLSDEMLMDLFKQWSQLYYIDGLVIYINDLRMWERIGRQQTSGNPLYAIAYKHPDFTESFETTVKGITWNVSKAGALKPVVNIEMVDTGDCNMENPTGYNASWVDNHKIAPGAKILVTRSGGVIPKILETLVEPTEDAIAQQREALKVCPVCGAATKWDEPEVYCTNPDCGGVKLAKIIFFFTTVGVENMGEELFKKLYQSGFTTIKQILNITFRDLVRIEGIGDGIANIVLDNMKKIKKGVELTTLMHASDCFKGIGKVKAQKILSNMDGYDMESFLHGTLVETQEEPEIQNGKMQLSVTLQAFYSGANPFYRFVQENEIPIIMPSEQKVSSDKLASFNVCFSSIRDKNLEDKIVANGGKIASGVSKTTTHLVVKDTNATSSKIAKAQTLGIEIINIKNFTSVINSLTAN